MYAIISISGKQFKVSPGQYIYAPRIKGEAGATITSAEALLISREEDAFEVGDPTLDKATVTCTIMAHVKDDKVTVFKKKRRKGYAVKRGHRQDYTQLRIESIV